MTTEKPKTDVIEFLKDRHFNDPRLSVVIGPGMTVKDLLDQAVGLMGDNNQDWKRDYEALENEMREMVSEGELIAAETKIDKLKEKVAELKKEIADLKANRKIK